MLIWCAINLDKELSDLKNEVKIIENSIKFKESNITLPMHVSLKMSMDVNEDISNEVFNTLEKYLSDIKMFHIIPLRIELHDTICWLKMKDNEMLSKIHNDLNNLMLEKFNIPLHKFDKDFIFHTTLFLDSDANDVKNAFIKIKDYKLPEMLLVNNMFIGYSLTGELGTYKILKEINLKSN